MNQQTIETLLNLGKFFQDNNIQYAVTGSFAIKRNHEIPNDVDLYIGEHPFVNADNLHKMGFTFADSTTLAYTDELIIGVWRNISAHVDIQVVKDFNIKTKAQNLILTLPSFWNEFLTKENISQLWNWAIDQVSEGK